jgi:ketosteroid isomerase-like protein
LARIGATFLLLLSLCSSVAAQGPSPDPAGAIRKLLNGQVAAWNRHDLEGFMAGYWKSPALTFFSGGTELRGWQATLERYRRRYQSEGREMGRLDFAELRIEPLGGKAALVRGRYHLVMQDGKEMGGVFTLIVRRFPEGWKIVHDHTSSAP